MVYGQIFTEWLVAFVKWRATYRRSESFKYIFNLFLMDNSDFDLSYAFTFQKFEHGTVGSSMTKGIQKDTPNFNVGVVTLRGEGGRLDARDVQRTLAHEIGHSEHDDDNDPEGPFIMTKRLQESDAPLKFSKKSIRQISSVLDDKQRSEPHESVRATTQD